MFSLIAARIANIVGSAVAFPVNRYFLRKRIELKGLSYLKPVLLFCVWFYLVSLVKSASMWLNVEFLSVFMISGFFSQYSQKMLSPFLVGRS